MRTKTPITSYDDLPAKAVIECAQLTKDNSIEGCKKSEVVVIYTWASNLLKNDTMETGAVSFHNRKLIVNLDVAKEKEGGWGTEGESHQEEPDDPLQWTVEGLKKEVRESPPGVEKDRRW